VRTFLRIGPEREASHEATDDPCLRRCRSNRYSNGNILVHSTKLSAGSATMPSLQELHTAAGVNKLPIEEFEDMSLEYPTATKRQDAAR